jgi:hypothetical protein
LCTARGRWQAAIKERLERAGIEVLGVTDHHFASEPCAKFLDANYLLAPVELAFAHLRPKPAVGWGTGAHARSGVAAG